MLGMETPGWGAAGVRVKAVVVILVVSDSHLRPAIAKWRHRKVVSA